MTPITDSQVIELAHVYAIRWKMNRTDTSLLTSLLRRVYAEGQLSGVEKALGSVAGAIPKGPDAT